jgi:hypothetical protein
VANGRGWRFALEVAFLVALAVVLGIAEVGTSIIVIVMLAGWVLVALLEWAAWREEPHWGSGSPPRYYVPPTVIPPRRVIDQGFQVDQGYPARREPEASTWIATPEMRAAALEDWPVPPPADQSEPAEEPGTAAESPETAAAEVVPEVAAEAQIEHAVEEPLEDALLSEAAAAMSLEDAPMAAEEPSETADANGSDPWEVQSFPQGPLLEGVRTSWHRIDPLAEPEGRRWPWQRPAGGAPGGATEFPARPRHVLLPERREDER